MRKRFFLAVCLFGSLGLVALPLVGARCSLAQERPAQKTDSAAASISELATAIEPFMQCIKGEDSQFAMAIEAELSIDGQVQSIQANLNRFDDESFDMILSHPDYAVEIRRRATATAFALPKHGVVFLGAGETDAEDQLAPLGATKRLIGSGCQIATYLPLINGSDAQTVLQLCSNLVQIQRGDAASSWTIDRNTKLKFTSEGDLRSLQVTSEGMNLVARLTQVGQPASANDWPGMRIEPLDRAELERHLSRGVRRALEVLMPSPQLTNPPQMARTVEHGELRYVDGQRLVILSGTPEQIGTAHGKLLRRESERCIDSVLYAFGTAQTIANGRWFRKDLAAAYKRLKPHIPVDHIAETRALASALNQDPDVLETLNVFPELFHCSGFAVFNSATVDGKLYHGRVLDYMTTIGLQDSATTFVVSVEGKIPFANIGYAGFTGSVSGMNSESISLGEMGGRGEGLWDGVPMATLMRRAMEECDSLDEVIKLWSTSPRTCEYYYVFADGQTNEAVGVAATPDSIQFVAAGEGHELLGEGIPDAVVLSAGSRLELLRKRVTENHGKLDVKSAMDLMSRPVAMQSNLHNVLFVPADGVFYVANANHEKPAAERPYVKFDLQQILKSK